MNCPDCRLTEIVSNGSNSVGTPKFWCKGCGRQFVETPKKQAIAQETKALIDRWLLERIPLAGIARVTGVSERWLQPYVNEQYDRTPRQVEVKKVSWTVNDRVR
jgi:insertion element IS1 protein InsB